MFAGMILFNVLLPQMLWFKAVRRNVPALCVVSVGILIGMWFERILILWNTLGHDHLPTMWRNFQPTGWDWAILAGSIGAFVVMFLLFVRLVPVVSMFEMRELALEERGT